MTYAPQPGETSPLSRQALETLAQIDTEISRRRGGRPLDYIYKPHKQQQMIHESKAKITACFAANRIGKTLAGMAEIFWRGQGKHPYKQVRAAPIHMWWVVPSYAFFEEVVIDSGLWAQWAPRDQTVNLRHSPQLKLEFANGSTCTVMSQEMGLRRFMGAAPAFIYMDEKIDEVIYGECVVRIATSRGQILYAATLVEGIGWEYEALWLPGTSGQHTEIYAFSAALCERDPYTELDVGRSLVPHLSYEDILSLARTIPDPQMRAVRIFGEIAGRTGLIMEFEPNVHLIEPFNIPDWWPVWAGCDPGFNGFSVTFGTVTPENQTVVWGEYFSQKQSTQHRTTRMREIYDKLQRPLDDNLIIFVDTANQQDVLEMNERFYDDEAPMTAVSLQMGKKAVKAGVDRMQWMLYGDDESVYPEVAGREDLYGAPRLMFFNDLGSDFVTRRGDNMVNTSRHLWEMGRWKWKEAREGKVEKDEPDDYSADGAHAMASLRYLLMARFGSVEEPSHPISPSGIHETILRQMGH